MSRQASAEQRGLRSQASDSAAASAYSAAQADTAAADSYYNHLDTAAGYKKGDSVNGYIYEINEKMGAFVAVEDKYQGLIPKQELHKRVNVGDTMKLRVSEVREDGKLNLSISQLAYQQMEEDSEMVYQAIMSFDGVLPFNDKASPQLIERELGLSKAAFKRAVGRLLKEGRIEIHEHSIVTK